MDSISQFIENDGVYNLVMTEPEFAPDGFLCNTCDGSLYRNHNMFQQNRKALQLCLYFDDLEVCNPIGKSAGVHKIAVFYYSILNMAPQYRARLPAIRLITVVKRKSINKHGIQKILNRIKVDLDQLSDGINVTINGENVNLRAALIAFCGDTLSSNEFAGFKQGVGFSFQKCRECECTNTDMQSKFNERNFIPRTLNRYDQQINELLNAPSIGMRRRLSTAYGINERSVARDFPHFDLTQMVPVDVMHIIFEGAAVYEVKPVLNKLVSNGLFSLNLLNSHIDNLPYGYKHRESRPTAIPQKVFQNEEDSSNLKQSSASMMTLLTFLPMLLIDRLHVSSENIYVEFILETCEIVKILLAPAISYETIQLLRTLIEGHLKKFKELFPSKNILPKQHFMIHFGSAIEKYGPLCNISCMRFEGKHSFIKQRVSGNNNFKNIDKSIIQKCGMYECALNLCEKHPLFTNDMMFGKSLTVNLYYAKTTIKDFFGTNMDCIKSVHSVSWAVSNGQKFIPKQCEIAFGENYDLPEFGRLLQIWVSMEDHDGIELRNVYFLLQMYETEYFDENMQAYCVKQPEIAQGNELVLSSNIFLPMPLHIYNGQNKKFITVPYDLTDVIQLRKQNFIV